MKPRRVVLTIEVETDVSLSKLRRTDFIELVDDGLVFAGLMVDQLQANVIRSSAVFAADGKRVKPRRDGCGRSAKQPARKPARRKGRR